MQVNVLKEAGYDEACLGLSLSYDSTIERARDVLPKLAYKQGGHNKALESMMIWVDITAPRFWWQQADTYRISTKQSSSTMHTIMKRLLTAEDFDPAVPASSIADVNQMITAKDFERVKAVLPEGFLQRRIWCMSYKTLQNIVAQRSTHKLYEWKYFCEQMVQQIDHPEFIIKEEVIND